MSESVQRFERFEFKYWAPRARVDAALQVLSGFMQEDEVARQAGASQVNTSLYFDSPRFTFLEQHLSGSPDRIKLRVRYYGLAPKGECFFEIKRRQNAQNGLQFCCRMARFDQRDHLLPHARLIAKRGLAEPLPLPGTSHQSSNLSWIAR